jgi:NAD(P)-dependent dehydrogenase (short-subunit alcohol dehydrogenase family)
MSEHDESQKRALTRTGRDRRRFLQGTALAVAGTSAAALVRAQAPANCPAVATPMKDVAGKVAFITGGNSGIGLGIARTFVDAGMKVAITYRTKANLDEAMKHLQSAGDRVHAINVDVTDRTAMENAAIETEKVFNNAGVGVIGGLSTATYDDWDWAMGVNLTGVFNGIRTFLPRIRSHGEGGQVIATSSLAGLLGHGPAGVYTATKFAVVGMMEALRAELDGTNIGVSVFCPGIVNTNIGSSNRNRPSDLADAGFKPDPKMIAQMQAAMKEMRGPPPGMSTLEAGQLVLRGMRNNDLYILTSPEFEPEFRARGEAIVASIPADVKVPEGREQMGRMILGKQIYAAERDRRRCTRKA